MKRERERGGGEENRSHARLAILSIQLVNTYKGRFSQCSYLGSLLYSHEAGSALVTPD